MTIEATDIIEVVAERIATNEVDVIDVLIGAALADGEAEAGTPEGAEHWALHVLLHAAALVADGLEICQRCFLDEARKAQRFLNAGLAAASDNAARH